MKNYVLFVKVVKVIAMGYAIVTFLLWEGVKSLHFGRENVKSVDVKKESIDRIIIIININIWKLKKILIKSKKK